MENRVALVTGAVKGIGKEIGLSLARQGFKVALTWHDWEEAYPQMTADFKAFGTDAAIFNVNLRDTSQIQSLIDTIIQQFGRLDILINNIERGGMPIVHGTYTPAQWNLEVETTLRAKQWLFDCAYPHLMKSQDGIVINYSSIAAITGRLGPASYLFNEGYASFNRSISLLTETWARLCAPNVRVNEIMLGLIDTRHGTNTRGWGLLPDDIKQELIDHTLTKRIGSINDVVKTTLFLIQDAPFITGTVIRVDGGYVLGGETIRPMPDGVEKIYE